MMLFKKIECSDGLLEMDIDREQKSGFRKGGPRGRWMGLLVLLGAVAMVISMVMVFVICGDLVKKVMEVQNSVSSLNLHLNKSGDPMPNGVPEKRLSNIETLVNSVSSSLSSVTSKQDGNLQRLEQHQDASNTEMKNLLLSLSSSVSALTSKLNDAVTKLEKKPAETEQRPSCKSGWIPYGSSCYLFSTNTLNWMESRDYCKEQGASLLKLDGSEAEWAFVIGKAIPNVYWIGLTDQTTGQWRWTDGTPYIMIKEHWDEGQPDDWKDPSQGEESEDCGLIRWNGKLNDSHCFSKYGFLCKVKIAAE